MKLTKEEVLFIKESTTRPFNIYYQDIHDMSNDWLKMNEQADIDKDFIKQYQAEVEWLKKQRREIIKRALGILKRVIQYTAHENCLTSDKTFKQDRKYFKAIAKGE